jgi:hypothetical protein
MQGTVHLLVGAAIGLVVPHPPTMFVLAFFSHYLLDLVPHIDPETFAHKKKPYTWIQRTSLTVDVILVIGLMVALYNLRHEDVHILLGAVAAQLPDLMSPLEQHNAFYPLRRMHDMFHWNPKRAKYWKWYLSGLVVPIVTAGASLYIIWKF